MTRTLHPPRPTGALAWAAVGAFGVLALTQIAIPLTSDDATIEWLSSLVAVAFFATSLALAADRWGASRAAVAAASVVVATLGVERLGSTTGFPFGEYDYTGALVEEARGDEGSARLRAGQGGGRRLPRHGRAASAEVGTRRGAHHW